MESTSEDAEPSSVFWTNQRQEYRAGQKSGWRREYITLNEVYTKLSIHELTIFLLHLHSLLPLQQKVPEIIYPFENSVRERKKSMQDPLQNRKEKERKRKKKERNKQTNKKWSPPEYYFIASFELQSKHFFGCADKFLNFTVFVSNCTKKMQLFNNLM